MATVMVVTMTLGIKENSATVLNTTLLDASIACMNATCVAISNYYHMGNYPTITRGSAASTVALNAVNVTQASTYIDSLSPLFVGNNSQAFLRNSNEQPCRSLQNSGVAIETFTPSLDVILQMLQPRVPSPGSASWNKNWQYFILTPTIVLFVAAIAILLRFRRNRQSAAGSESGNHSFKGIKRTHMLVI